MRLFVCVSAIVFMILESASAQTHTGGSGGSGSGGGGLNGTVTYTSSQTASTSDNGKTVVMNCSSACAYTLPNPQPSTTWQVNLQSTGSTVATVALGTSMTYNGLSGFPTLSNNQIYVIAANTSTSTDYRGQIGGYGGQIYASSYGVVFDGQEVATATVSNTGTTVTCSACNFTAADAGKIEWGTTAVNDGTLIVPQGTITAVNSSSSVTVSNAATAGATGTLVFAWCHDDSTPLQNAWNAALSTCKNLILPAGKMCIQSALSNASLNAACTANGGVYQAAGMQGENYNTTWIVFTPSFNFSSCTGGTSLAGCLGGTPNARFNNFTVTAGGNNFNGVNLGGAVFLDVPNSSGINQVSMAGLAYRSTNSTCVGLYGSQAGLYQGGEQYCGATGLHVVPGSNVDPATANSWFIGPALGNALLVDSTATLDTYGVTYSGGPVTVNGTLNSFGDWFSSTGTTVSGSGTCRAFGSYIQGTSNPPGFCRPPDPGIAGQLASYSFGIVESPISLGGTFIAAGSGNSLPKVPSAGICEVVGTSASYAAFDTGYGTWPNNQWSAVYIGTSTGINLLVSLDVRMATGADTAYQVNWANNTTSTIYAIVAGTAHSLGTFTAPMVAGDVIYLSVEGVATPVITAVRNGVQVAQFTDSSFGASITSGLPGFQMFSPVAIANLQITKWAGGGASR